MEAPTKMSSDSSYTGQQHSTRSGPPRAQVSIADRCAGRSAADGAQLRPSHCGFPGSWASAPPPIRAGEGESRGPQSQRWGQSQHIHLYLNCAA